MAAVIGKEAWWAVPLAGGDRRAHVRQRRRDDSRCPGSSRQGGSLRDHLAFMMSVIALSLPEMIILRRCSSPGSSSSLSALSPLGFYLSVTFLTRCCDRNKLRREK